MTLRKLFWTWVMASSAIGSASYVQAAEEGYLLDSSRWTTNRVPVCWENGSAGTSIEQDWVKNRVMQTWDAASAVSFTGWGNCGPGTTSGIRIRIQDVGPHVVSLGKSLNNVTNGMSLNFTFSS